MLLLECSMNDKRWWDVKVNNKVKPKEPLTYNSDNNEWVIGKGNFINHRFVIKMCENRRGVVKVEDSLVREKRKPIDLVCK